MATIAIHAAANPDKIAVILGNGEFVETFGELEERSRRWAALFRERGLGPGGCVAVLVENTDPSHMDIFWACHRAGLYFTPVNWHLQEEEIQYIVENSDADVLVVSPAFAEVAARVVDRCPRVKTRIVTSGAAPAGFESAAEALTEIASDADLGEEREGAIMVYSSGTTGRPKGVRRPLPDLPAGAPALGLFAKAFLGFFGINEDDRYLCPAPLYHTAPLPWQPNPAGGSPRCRWSTPWMCSATGCRSARHVRWIRNGRAGSAWLGRPSAPRCARAA